MEPSGRISCYIKDETAGGGDTIAFTGIKL